MSSAVASIDEVAPETYRINVALPDAMPGGFSFNQYLVVDEMPLIFHTGPRRLFPLIREQIETVLPISKLRYIAFSHVESDECGSLSEFLHAAPGSRPVCSEVAQMVSVSDLVDVEPLAWRTGRC
jgi:flavorubredoxin